MYASIADMTGHYGTVELIQRTNLDDPDAAEINAEVLERALADASAEIDSYLGRYTLPFATVPALLNKLCRSIARKNLYFDAPSSQDKPQWRRDYEDAVRLLEGISSGAVDLGSQQSAPHAAIVTTQCNRRVFTRDQLSSM